MCGIAGALFYNPQTGRPEIIKNMCDAMAHRGPDDAGYLYGEFNGKDDRWRISEFTDVEFAHKNHRPAWSGGDAGKALATIPCRVMLGHRRLAILDLSADGHQPMSNENRTLWLLHNGEIYNHQTLRALLEEKEIVFRSHTDTEVILRLWDEYGIDCLKHLKGMYAFSVLDLKQQKLFLVRDRFGIKPLYYFRHPDGIVFASEIKGILASGLAERKIDEASLAEYFTFQNIFSDGTLFQGIKMLMSGEYLEIDLWDPSAIRKVAYWKPHFSVSGLSFKKTSSRLGEVFEDTVRRHLISDVEVGSFLSGGMDSGAIVAVMRGMIPHLSTFTVGFDLTHVTGIEQGFDERDQSEVLANLFQTEHYEAVLHSGDMPRAMERLTWFLDDPRVGMCHPNWYASKLASRFVKVCLSGTGGDELFGGYPWRYGFANAPSVEAFDQQYFLYWHRLIRPSEFTKFFNADAVKADHQRMLWERYCQIMADAPRENESLDLASSLLNRAFYFELKTFLHGLLIVEDRMSMAHSMETRVPFLDDNLGELALAMKPHYKVKPDRSQHDLKGGKTILRSAMKHYLPAKFVRQKKKGFSPPDENWYRGPSMEYIKEILLDPKTRARPFLNSRFVEEKLNDHFSGRQNNRLLIWSLLCFEWLQRHFIDEKMPASGLRGLNGKVALFSTENPKQE